MKALPSLFVGLAALSAGCSSWNNRPSPGLAGPQPSLAGELHTAVAPQRDSIPSPSLALELDADRGSPVAMTARTTQSDVWHAEYESQQRRPIHTLRVGDGERRIFVTGSFQGDDPLSVGLLDDLATRLTAPEAAPASRFLLVRTPNPDGLESAQSFNANGVELNRNFPTLRYLRTSDDRSGSFPASEPETRIILRLLNEFQPDCVVQVRTAEIPMTRVFANPGGESAWGSRLDELHVARGRFNEIAASGSLEEFASQRLHAETMTVIVPASQARQPATVDTLLALFGGALSPAGPAPTADGGRPAVAESGPGSAPAELTGVLEPIEQDGVHGYVELLPPPPESGTDRSGFHELPPPR